MYKKISHHKPYLSVPFTSDPPPLFSLSQIPLPCLSFPPFPDAATFSSLPHSTTPSLSTPKSNTKRGIDGEHEAGSEDHSVAWCSTQSDGGATR